MVPQAAPHPVNPEDLEQAGRLLLAATLEAAFAAHLGGEWRAFLAAVAGSQAFVVRVVEPALLGRPLPADLRVAPPFDRALWIARRTGAAPATAAEAIALLLDAASQSAPAARATLWRYAADRLREAPATSSDRSSLRAVFAETLRDTENADAAAEAAAALRRLDAWDGESALRLGLARDAALLAPKDAFDAGLYFGGAQEPSTREAAIRTYLGHAPLTDFRRPPAPGEAMRRPLPGFHPMAYGRQAPGFAQDGRRTPLAHFIAHGRPAGPWTHEVIRLDELPPPADAPALGVALHGHFHYVDHIGDFLQALTANRARADLFLTTTGDAQAETLREATRGYGGGRVLIEVGENRGRDIAPFLRVLQAHVLGRYDVVGHLHGKRSAEASARVAGEGDRWRDFLWRSLLGPDLPVLDLLLDRFAADPTLGLVFPEHPVAMGWDANADIARAIAPRLGLTGVPEHIEFPVGAMFWARPEALRPLVDATFGPDEFPPEPAPHDGSLMHALERMFALVAEGAGFRFATTYRPEVTR